jgi:SAM-dependent methyltransferase
VYGPDLAFVHDAGFGDYARNAAPVVLRELRTAGVHPGARVVELGCGSGILTQALADSGYEVVGVDVSEPMLSIAAQRMPDADFLQGSLHEIDLPYADAFVAVGEVVAYGEADLSRTLDRLRQALHPGGVLLFDAPLTDRGTGSSWRSGDGWTIQSESTSDTRRLERKSSTSVRLPGGGWRRNEELHVLRLYGRDELLQLLEDAGFDARQLPSDNDWCGGLTGMAAFVAQRPRS